MNYCRRCGHKLSSVEQSSFTCDQGHTIYANSSPTVGIFLFNGKGEILFGVRGIEPHKGTIDSPGGFVELGETIEHALEREVKEELGLDSSDYSTPEYLISAPSQYEYGGETITVLSSFFTAKLLSGATPIANDDVSDIRWLRPEDVSIHDIGGDDIKAGFRALHNKLAG